MRMVTYVARMWFEMETSIQKFEDIPEAELLNVAQQKIDSARRDRQDAYMGFDYERSYTNESGGKHISEQFEFDFNK